MAFLQAEPTLFSSLFPSPPPSLPPPSLALYRYHEITETSGVEVEAALVAFPAALRYVPSLSSLPPSLLSSTPPPPFPSPGEDSFLRLCCDLYERTGKTWIFEQEATSLILKYKW